MLKNQEKLLKQKVDYIWERRGLRRARLPDASASSGSSCSGETGEGAVMAELKRRGVRD